MSICRARPLWPSAPKMGNWLPCNGGRPQGPRPARGSECTSDSQGQHWVSLIVKDSIGYQQKWPFAGRGPCGRPHPGWEIGYPAMADGHKGRALQEDRNVRPIVKGSIGYQQNGHLQGAALVAVRTQDGKLVTLQRRTCLSVICSSVVGLLRWKEYIKKHKKFLIFLINILDFIVLCKIRNNDRTIEYII